MYTKEMKRNSPKNFLIFFLTIERVQGANWSIHFWFHKYIEWEKEPGLKIKQRRREERKSKKIKAKQETTEELNRGAPVVPRTI